MAIDSNVGDIITVRLEYLNGTDVAYNLLHYRVTSIDVTATGLPSATTIPLTEWVTQAGQEFFEDFSVLWKTIASSDVVMTGVTVQDISPAPRSRPFTFLPAAPVAGLKVGDALPFQDSLTILKKTAYGERWGIGRVFIAGLSESQQAGGNIVVGERAQLSLYASQFKESVTVSTGVYDVTLQPVLYQEIMTGSPPVGTGVFRTTGLIDATIDSWSLKTQRRRRPGKGI